MFTKLIRSNDWTLLIRYVSLTIVISVLLSLFAQLSASLAGSAGLQNVLTTMNFMEPRTWAMLAMSCVLEEILFRGVLSLSRRAIAVSTFFWLLMASFYLTKHLVLSSNPADGILHVTLACCAIFSLIATYFVCVHYIHRLRSTLANHYNGVFWAFCLLFALAHILNYTNRRHVFAIYLILVIPQFIMGAILSVIRIRHGIAWSIAAHFMVDAWLFLCVMVGHMKGSHIVPVIVGISLLALFLFGLVQFKLAKAILKCLGNPCRLLCGGDHAAPA